MILRKLQKQIMILLMISKGCCRDEIENGLQIRFGHEAMKSSIIYQKMRLVQCHVDITKEREYHSERIDEQLVVAIQNVLNEFMDHTAYRNIVTGDQSWFLYQYHPKGRGY